MSNIKKENVANPTKKPVRLFDLLMEHKPIWVVNNTQNVAKKRISGTMRISLGTGIPPLVVPPGADPVCLSDQAPYEMLKGSSDLITMINKQLLKLLDPSDAELYYAQNEERRDYIAKQIAEYQNSIIVDDHDKAKVIYGDEPKTRNKSVELINDKSNPFHDIMPVQKVDTSKTAQVNGRVQNCYYQLKAGNMPVQLAFEQLIEVEGALSKNDFNYILNNYTEEPIRKWAKKNLEK